MSTIRHQLLEIFKEKLSVSTDTREIKAQSMFFALKGENFNGNSFVKKAFELGASYCIVDEASAKINEQCILVNDVLESLQQLGADYRNTLDIPIIGITGTNGKTTTKELIAAVLNEKLNCYATKGNLNNHIGVPLSLLSIGAQDDIAIIEMGANHPGEIKMLSEIAKPSHGIITNIGKAHLEGFGGYEGVKKTKKELYDFMENNNGVLFYNSDNLILQSILPKAIHSIPFSTKEADVNNAQEFLAFKYKGVDYKTQLVGNYNLENALAAICIGNYFGLNTLEIKNGIEKYAPKNNRSQIIHQNTNTIIMDAYNANPTSILAAIENFHQQKKGNKICVLGDMYELGEDSEKEHLEIIEACKKLDLGKVIFIGKEFGKHNQSTFTFVQDCEEALKLPVFKDLKNAYILLKASRGMKFEQLLPLF